MPILPAELTRTLLPRILSSSFTVPELLALFQEQAQPHIYYAVVRLAADAYDVLTLADLDVAAQQHGRMILALPLSAVPGLLQPTAAVRQATIGMAAADRALHATPRRRLVVIDDSGGVSGILVANMLGATRESSALDLLVPGVLGTELSPLLPHLNTRFDGLAPDQSLPVGQRVPLIISVGQPGANSHSQRSEPFQFSFTDNDTPVKFTVQVHAFPETWTVKAIEPTLIVAPPGITTQEAEFLVTAKQPGRDTLYLTIERNDTGTTVQHLCLPVYAIQMGTTVMPTACEHVEISLPLEETSLTRRTVEIALQPSESAEAFTAIVRADLDGHTIWETYRIPVSTVEIQNATLRLRQELEKLVFYPGKNTGERHPFTSTKTLTIDEEVARETAIPLADAGQQVWQLLFQSPRAPDELKQFAADIRTLPHGSSIQIVLYSQRFIIPWALLYDQPGPITADTLDWSGFWGYRYRLEAIPPGRYPSLTINEQPPGLLAFFNDDINLRTFTTAQEGAISKMIDGIQYHGVWGDSSVQQMLRAPETAALVYCFCHGIHTSGAVTTTKLASESALSFSTGKQLRLADLRRLPAAYFSQRPLVFINACEGATQDAFYYDGFMPYFIEEMGARGFIGTEVKAPTFLAHDLGLRFLQAFMDGQPVGDILWQIRRHYVDMHHNILGFNYSLYCPGDVRLAKVKVSSPKLLGQAEAHAVGGIAPGCDPLTTSRVSRLSNGNAELDYVPLRRPRTPPPDAHPGDAGPARSPVRTARGGRG